LRRPRGRGKPRPYISVTADCLLLTAYLLIRHDREFDRARVGAGLDYEIVFQLPLVAVIHQVHARIDVRIFHLGVVRHVGAPLLGIIADEVVRLARQFVETDHFGVRVGAYQFHAQHGVRGRCSAGLAFQALRRFNFFDPAVGV